MGKAVRILFGLILAMSIAARADVVWIRPEGTAKARAIWGIEGGISVGLWPTEGPRGLIRIYTPYLQQAPGRIMNFIAVEPIVAGHRGYSELEHSALDKQQGRRMWTTDSLDGKNNFESDLLPSRGVINHVGSAEVLSFYILVERYENGAKPIVEIQLRSDRPDEVSLKTFAAPDSAPMESCVLTATMGNWARLRHLRLKDRIINARDIFRDQPRDALQFFRPVSWTSDQLIHENGELVISATGERDQSTPADVPAFWCYQGLPAVQTWRTAAAADIKARVNGRTTFWASKTPIPGGAAFENFEMISPFHSGQEFRFSITRQQTSEGQHP